MVAPFGEEPARIVRSRDGTPIAVFAGGTGHAGPILLVHGTASDHRTWRVVAPLLAAERAVFAMDRRGRGASGDSPGYAPGRELDDLVATAEALGPVVVVGHSLGGRLAIAASARTSAIRAVVAYESAPLAESRRCEPDAERGPETQPAPETQPGLGTRPGPGSQQRGDTDGLLAELRDDLARGDLDALLARFMTRAVGMPADDLAAFRANPIWADRAATGATIVRELDAATHDPAIGMDALALTRTPVLQLVGGASPAWFLNGALALDRRLADGRLALIDGARHAAHHSHPAAFVAAVREFTDALPSVHA